MNELDFHFPKRGVELTGFLNASQHAEILYQLEEHLSLSHTLPFQVFRRPSAWTFWIFDADFVKRPTTLQPLAHAHGDNVLHYISLSPNAAKYYEDYGVLGAFSVQAHRDFERVWKEYLYARLGSNHDALEFSSTVFAVFGDSGRWLAYGDVYAHLGILAQKGLGRSPVRLSMCTDDAILKSDLDLEFRHLVEFEAYFEEFAKNYLGVGYKGSVFQHLL